MCRKIVASKPKEKLVKVHSYIFYAKNFVQTHSFLVNLESLCGCFQKYLTFSLLCKIDYHNKMTAVPENAHIELTKPPIMQKGPPPPIASEITS